ncbi:hypothetical protein E2562_020552 [Oryza meyeriana var. granulata]|uniref:Uncharacterized protein n=1 Tax=Oryza meyeriana var. granulata TaxID=110450 RepID=A0A6G1EBV1_9ORYZ|nr:hypothetical protein E2562_020552 [Oryza meyeriana var. granulata]
MEDDQTTSEYYLAEHMSPPPESVEVMEEAESSVVSSEAHGSARGGRQGRGWGHGSRGAYQPFEEVEDRGTTLQEVKEAAVCVAGEAPVAIEAEACVVVEAGDRENEAVTLREVETVAARVAAEAMEAGLALRRG